MAVTHCVVETAQLEHRLLSGRFTEWAVARAWPVLYDDAWNDRWLIRHGPGKHIGTPRPTTWSIEFHVREDAESMFVPAELLPHARPGDAVEVRSVSHRSLDAAGSGTGR